MLVFIDYCTVGEVSTQHCLTWCPLWASLSWIPSKAAMTACRSGPCRAVYTSVTSLISLLSPLHRSDSRYCSLPLWLLKSQDGVIDLQSTSLLSLTGSLYSQLLHRKPCLSVCVASEYEQPIALFRQVHQAICCLSGLVA